MSGGPVALLAALTILAAALAAVLSAGESAVLRVTRTAVLEATGDDADGPAGPRARRALALLADPGATARSVGFVRVVAEVAAVGCLTLLVAAWLDPWWQVLLVALVVSVVVGLVVVRASPRSLGRRHAVRVLLALAGPLTALTGRPGGSRGSRRRRTPARTSASCGTWWTASTSPRSSRTRSAS